MQIAHGKIPLFKDGDLVEVDANKGIVRKIDLYNS
jgi:dihydroxyacid dehydratase/phosphogluconate dehydratase